MTMICEKSRMGIESAAMIRTEPDYKSEGVRLWPMCRAFYQDPENEAAFQAWKKEREKNETAGRENVS